MYWFLYKKECNQVHQVLQLAEVVLDAFFLSPVTETVALAYMFDNL